MFRTGKPSFDVHYHLERGNKIFHEVKAYPIKDALGKVSHSIYVFRDVTERETMYERVREAKMRLEELNSMKSYFISIASHELKTPLAIVKGYVDVMQDGVLGRVNRKQKEKLEAISLNIRHLSNLVENILDLSRIEAGELKLNRRKTDVNRLVSGILRDFRPLAEERGITLSFRKAVLGRVMMDPDRMKQVIINLLDNSLKFTPHGGRITVSTRRMQNQLALTVRDTGVGIPKKSLGRIFDRFYQVDSTSHRKYKGFGLGLSICKSIVELHGGSISIKSRVNRGTSVSITLPV
jgi:signal transduction histidine kinase